MFKSLVQSNQTNPEFRQVHTESTHHSIELALQHICFVDRPDTWGNLIKLLQQKCCQEYWWNWRSIYQKLDFGCLSTKIYLISDHDVSDLCCREKGVDVGMNPSASGNLTDCKRNDFIIWHTHNDWDASVCKCIEYCLICVINLHHFEAQLLHKTWHMLWLW